MNIAKRIWNQYREALWALLILFFALYFFWKSGEISRIQPAGQLSPAFWPRVILGCLIVFSVVKGLLGFANAGKGRPNPGVEAENRDDEPTKRERWRLVGGILLVLGYAYLTEIIGFPLANFLFLFSLMYLSGMRSLLWLLLLPFPGTIALLYLFVKLVYVPLPRGMGFFEDLTLSLYRLLAIF